MKFVELVERVRQECSIQAENGVQTVAGQTGMIQKLVNWVRDEYLDIQNMPHRFNWMREKVLLPLTANVYEYPLDDAPWSRPDILEFEPGHAQLLDANRQYQRCAFAPFDEFDRCFPFIQHQGQPGGFTLDPARHVVFNAIPQAAYQLSAWVRLAPQSLEADDDEPRMPSQHHMTIVHKAVLRYATHDGDQSLLQDHGLLYDAKLGDLLQRTVPAVTYRARPLV